MPQIRVIFTQISKATWKVPSAKFIPIIVLLLLVSSTSLADSSNKMFAECKEVSGAAFVVSSLKNDGMSADDIRLQILKEMEVSEEVKQIYLQQIEMAFSSEHIQKNMEEYNQYVYQWCTDQLK